MSPRKRNRTTTTDPAPAAATAKPQVNEEVPDPAEAPRRRSWRELGPVLLLRAAHPRQALVTALALTVVAALSGRPVRELGLVLATVLVGQAIIGWHNDLVDQKRDEANETARKPLAEGLLDRGTVWFVLTCAVLLVVPLALSNGLTAGSAYLLSMAIGLMGNQSFRRGLFSWLTWALSFALYPAFLSYGGWGGAHVGEPPEITITVLAALLGVCVHVLRALPGLVADHREGQRHLPLRIALRIGAPRLLWVTVGLTVLVVAALAVEGTRVGLAQ
jgi:4-hydroxybenzoate polyprenyltransferase